MKKIYLAIVAVLFVVGLLVGGIALNVLPIGQTTLSLSQASFTNNLPGLSCSKGWIMTVTQGGLGQQAYGVISAEDVGASSGTTPKYDLNINMMWDHLAWEYPILVDYNTEPVYTYTAVPFAYSYNPLALGCLKENADSACGEYEVYGQWNNGLECFCVRKDSVTSDMGYLDNCNIHSISTVNVEAKGVSSSAVIDTKGQISSLVGNYVYVVWNGNLLKQNCPSQAPYRPLYNNGWKIGSDALYDQYRNANSILESELDYPYTVWDKTSLESKINDNNDKAYNFRSQLQQFGSIQNSFDTDEAYVELGLTSDAQVPVYTFYVCADLLEIYLPEPNPRILESKGATFKTGEKGNLYVKWKNIGDNGNMEVSAVCDSPMNVLDTAKTVYTAADDEGFEYIQVGTNINSHVDANCEIYVKGAGTNNQVSATVQVSADPQQVCTPNEKICDNNDIVQCNSAGSGQSVIEECGARTCTYKDGVPVCINTGDCSSDVDCDDDDECTEDSCVTNIWGAMVCSNEQLDTPECGGEVCPPIMVAWVIPVPDIVCLITEGLKWAFLEILNLVFFAAVIFGIIIAILIAVFLILRRRG